jgi:hypothetical protein
VENNGSLIVPHGVLVSPSRWCVQLVLSVPIAEHVEFAENGVVTGERTVERIVGRVTLAWPLAKALHKILGEVVAQYEDKEGEVALPRSFDANVGTLAAAIRAAGQRGPVEA